MFTSVRHNCFLMDVQVGYELRPSFVESDWTPAYEIRSNTARDTWKNQPDFADDAYWIWSKLIHKV